MNKILFLSIYPTEENIKDGMIQRIDAVDKEFKDWDKIYLYISLLRYFRKYHKVKNDDHINIYRVNLVVHFFLICKLLKQNSNLYIHSIHNFVKVFFFSFRTKNITLDLHGSVPEELSYQGHIIQSIIMSLVEIRAFKVASNFIFVSEEMQDFYAQKYSITKDKICKIKPIYSSNVLFEPDSTLVDKLRIKLGIGMNNTVLLYSGNLQRWQNFDLMIDTICRNRNDNYYIIILTGDETGARKILNKYDLGNMRYLVRCVSPQDLNVYYSLAHYGFILRDEHILNKVASPTKMIEYLYFGLMPIIKYERIGDTKRMGYDYVSYKNDLSKLKPQKSLNNKNIALKLLNKNIQVSLCDLYK